jgi:O-antigen ligase
MLILFSWLFSLLPIALVTGPFLPDLIVVSIGLFYIFILFKENDLKKLRSNFVFYFILFYFILILSSLLSENILFSFRSSLFYIRYLFFVLGASYLINEYPKLLDNFYNVLLITLCFLIFDTFFQYFFNVNLIGYERIEPYNYLSGIFNDENVLGSYISRLLPIFIGLYYIRINSNFNSFLFFLVIILSSILVFMSGERAAFFLLCLSSVIIILLTHSFLKIRIFLSLIITTSIVLIILFVPKIKDRMIDQTISSFGFGQTNIYFFSEGHHSLFLSSFEMFKEKPFLGQGPRMFRKLCNNEKYLISHNENMEKHCTSHPHNTYVQLFAETGIIGGTFIFIIFLFINYLFIKQLLSKFYSKIKAISNYRICMMSGIYITLWPLITTGNFFNNWISVFYFLPLCFLARK